MLGWPGFIQRTLDLYSLRTNTTLHVQAHSPVSVSTGTHEVMHIINHEIKTNLSGLSHRHLVFAQYFGSRFLKYPNTGSTTFHLPKTVHM